MIIRFSVNQVVFCVFVVFLISCKQKLENQSVINQSNNVPHPPSWVDSTKIIKEPILLDYVASSNTIKPNIENGVPYGKLDYDKIIGYDYGGSEEPYPNVIDENGKFVPVIIGQQSLSQKQADRILSTLTKKTTYGGGTAACFHPGFGLVFYKNNKKVCQISICLDCNYLQSEIDIPAESANNGNSIGFSKVGKLEIINLCKELKFRYSKFKIQNLK
ncbi:MAG: hypothetical protein ACRCVT_10195 [Leadbetterella sp.]